MRELLRRELVSDPSLALSEHLTGFFREGTPVGLAVDLAETRWQAAKDAGRWGLILADVESLRQWVPEVDEGAWVRLMISSAMNLAWARALEGDRVKEIAREIERIGTCLRDHSDELFQLEYVQFVKSGLFKLGGHDGPDSEIYRLLEISWDEPGPEFRARLRDYVAQLAGGPSAGLQCLDESQAIAPAVLGRLSTLLGGFEFEAYRFLDPNFLDEIAPALQRFLESHAWANDPTFRPSLLKFCLREAISPGLVARTIADRAEFILTGKNPLSHAINEDYPLRHVHRACEMNREFSDD